MLTNACKTNSSINYLLPDNGEGHLLKEQFVSTECNDADHGDL